MKRLMTVCLATAAVLVAITIPIRAQTGVGVRAGQISIQDSHPVQLSAWMTAKTFGVFLRRVLFGRLFISA